MIHNVKITTLIMLNILIIFIAIKASADILSKEETKAIDDYIANTPIDVGVGQLIMCGVPGDLLNYFENKHIETILCQLKIGNLFMNTYNYRISNYSDNKNQLYMGDILNFHNHLQLLAKLGNPLIPIMIGIDFEGPKVTSLEKGVIIPPSALTLSASQNAKLINQMGILVAHQLKSIGIHIIFGPVIDIITIKQNKSKQMALAGRSFGGDSEHVLFAASHYITGLHDGGIFTIGKHFPGHGNCEGDPHIEMPVFTGSPSDLEEQLKPFYDFKEYLFGIMTAHMTINFVEPTRYRPVTFSKEFVDELLRGDSERIYLGKKIKGLGYGDKVIVTDDLSDMGAVIKYKEKFNISFAQLALEAFEAGHDLLLFSHIETDSKHKRGRNAKFTINDLKQVVENLVNKINTSPYLMERYKASLRRILTLKSQINKTHPESHDKILCKDNIYWTNHFAEHSANPPRSYKYDYLNGSDLVVDIIKQACTIINNSTNFNISELSTNERIVFYINENYISLFKSEFHPRFPKSVFVPVSNPKKRSEFIALKAKLLSDIKLFDKIVYTVIDPDDSNIVDYVTLKAPLDVKNKLIILLHTSPLTLTDKALKAATIIGTFTRHEKAFIVDIDLLSGRLLPKPLTAVPLNLNRTDQTYENNSTKYSLTPAPPSNLMHFDILNFIFRLLHNNVRILWFALLIILAIRSFCISRKNHLQGNPHNYFASIYHYKFIENSMLIVFLLLVVYDFGFTWLMNKAIDKINN